MRADAVRNIEKLRAAATTLFKERGLNVPLKEIARAAEVSHGTIYNLYGSREALINEVVGDLARTRLEELGSQALAFEDAWEGFAFYVQESCTIQVVEPAIGDVLSGRFPQAEGLMNLCTAARLTAEEVVDRAHTSGQLRPDFTHVDLALSFGTLAHLARTSEPVAPGAWKRSMHFMLDGLRVDAATVSLPAPELKDANIYAALTSLATGPLEQ